MRGDGLAVVGILTDDPPDGAKAFIADHGATWPTVVDPGKAIKIGLSRRGSAADVLRRSERASCAPSRSVS